MNDTLEFISSKFLQVCIFFMVLTTCDILFFRIDSHTELYGTISCVSYISHLFIEFNFAETEKKKNQMNDHRANTYIITKNSLIDYSIGILYDLNKIKDILREKEETDTSAFWSYRKANSWDIGRINENKNDNQASTKSSENLQQVA
jgi:hypothetical protein